MKFSLINIFLFTQLILFTQNDWEKWNKVSDDYVIKDISVTRDYSFKSDNAGEFLIKSAANTYWFFISDVDGDNCPFRPSCSSFLVDAVKETNVLQGSLMFFDRFTRDINVFKTGNYARVKSGHYYDPAKFYTLSGDKINYIPPNEIVSE